MKRVVPPRFTSRSTGLLLLAITHCLLEFRHVRDRFVIHLLDHVAALETGIGGLAVRADAVRPARPWCSARKLQLLGGVGASGFPPGRRRARRLLLALLLPLFNDACSSLGKSPSVTAISCVRPSRRTFRFTRESGSTVPTFSRS